MTDDLLRELAELRNYAAAFHDLMSSAQSAAPASSGGSDRTGTVHAVLGRDGLPKRFRIDQHWRRDLRPADLGRAVLTACQSATGKRMATWVRTLTERGWHDEVEELRTAARRPRTDQVPPALRPPTATPNPRSADVLAEELIKAFDVAGAPQAPSPQAAGTDRSGQLTLILAPTGLVSCTADPGWAARQSAARLMTSLDQALAAARTRPAGQPAPDARAELGGLFAEALGLLTEPRSGRQTGGSSGNG